MINTTELQKGDEIIIRKITYVVVNLTAGRTHFWIRRKEFGNDGFYDENWDLSGKRPRLVTRFW